MWVKLQKRLNPTIMQLNSFSHEILKPCLLNSTPKVCNTASCGSRNNIIMTSPGFIFRLDKATPVLPMMTKLTYEISAAPL